MGIVKQQGVKNSIITYLSFGLGYINLILLYPNILTTGEFGLTRVLLTVATLVAQFASLGDAGIMIRFFPYYRSNKDAKDYLFIAFLIPLVGFILCLGVSLIFQKTFFSSYYERSQLFGKYFFLVYPYAFFILMTGIALNYSSVIQRLVVPNLLIQFGVKAGNTMAILLYYFKLISFNGFIGLFVFINGFILLTVLWYLRSTGQFNFQFKLSNTTRRLIKPMINYGKFGILAGSFSILLGYIDTVMLAGMSGLKETAIFTVGYYLATIISVPQVSMVQVLSPIISASMKNKDYEHIYDIYRKSALNQLIIGGVLFLLLWFNIDVFFKLLPNEYSAGKWVILLICLAKLTDMATGVNNEIIAYSRLYKFNFYNVIVVGSVAIIANYFLIKRFGYNGVAVSSLITIFFFNFNRFVFILKKLKMQPFSISSLKVLVILSVVFASLSFLPKVHLSNEWGSLLLNSGIRTSIILIISYLFFIQGGISPDMKDMSQKVMTRFGKNF